MDFDGTEPVHIPEGEIEAEPVEGLQVSEEILDEQQAVIDQVTSNLGDLSEKELREFSEGFKKASVSILKAFMELEQAYLAAAQQCVDLAETLEAKSRSKKQPSASSNTGKGNQFFGKG